MKKTPSPEPHSKNMSNKRPYNDRDDGRYPRTRPPPPHGSRPHEIFDSGYSRGNSRYNHQTPVPAPNYNRGNSANTSYNPRYNRGHAPEYASDLAPHEAGISHPSHSSGYGQDMYGPPYGGGPGAPYGNQPDASYGSAYPAPLPYEGERSRRTIHKEPPSTLVILQNLPDYVDDEMLVKFLDAHEASYESSNVAVDKATGASKHFAFVRFSSVKHARDFVEPHFPYMAWTEANPSDAKPKEDNAGAETERHGRDRQNPPRIRINYSHKNPGPAGQGGGNDMETLHYNDGSQDVGRVPSKMLLFLNIDPLIQEEDILHALSHVTNPRVAQRAAKGGVRSIMIARDRITKSSWGFAFVELDTLNFAKELMGSLLDRSEYPQGFEILKRVTNVFFANETSLTSAYASSEFTVKLESRDHDLKYWDEFGYLSIWQSTLPVPSPSGDDIDAFLTSIAAEAQASAVANKPAVASSVLVDNEIEPVISNALDSTHKPIKIDLKKGSAAKKNAPITSRKAAVNISKWNTRQEELHSSVSTSPPPEAQEEDQWPHSDPDAKICLLCQRKFKTVADLKKHNQLSDLHKKNLENESALAQCRERKEKLASTKSPKYLDRSAVRREALPVAPIPETHATDATAPVSKEIKHIEETNVGSKMLEKMGWSKGASLGGQSTGRTEPVEAAQYSRGAGLGAAKGIPISKLSEESKKTYVDRVKDAARARLLEASRMQERESEDGPADRQIEDQYDI